MPQNLFRSLNISNTAGALAASLALCLFAADALRLRAADTPPQLTKETTQGLTLEQKPRLFELRTYTTNPGKLDALHKRFREHTNDLFKKHGITIVGFWTPADEPRSKDTLIYIVAYPDREAREKAWKDFRADPDWVKAKAESEKDGPILVHEPESVFMNPTDYSPIK